MLAPTDSIRVWYPSLWAYVGEHGLVWGVFITVLFLIYRNKPVTEAFTVLICLIAELASTLEVWFVIPGEGAVSRAWYTGRFSDYLTARLTTWCVLALSAWIMYWFRYKRVSRRTEAPD